MANTDNSPYRETARGGSQAVAIPDPSPNLSWADLEALLPAFLVWIETVDDIRLAEECRLRLAALEEYIDRRGDDVGPVQIMARTNERRIGDLLPPVEETNGRPLRPDVKVIVHQNRHEFRRISDYWAIAVDLLPISRKKLLMAIKRAIEKEDELNARQIEEITDAENAGERWVMLAGDFRERLAQLPDGTVDLIVTDPPYPAEFQHLWSELAEAAKRILKPQGILLALSGKIALAEIIARLQEHLAYGWVYCQPLTSSTRILARHTAQAWKPWLAFSNGPWPSGRVEWHSDMLDDSPRVKDLYRWEQTTGPAIQLIHYLAPENGLILDPFAGTATYGIAALNAGRRFLGVEIDRDRYQTCCERLEEADT